MSRKNSYPTVTDQFCGAGGSSIGARKAGLHVRMAMNHWRRAVDTHNANFPETDHDCVDVSAADPRRYPSTDILVTSPECTTHSPAGGNRRASPQRDLFMPHEDDPSKARSRTTMRDVPRFAEYHRYRMIVVENVVEVTRWGPRDDGSLFAHWLREMELLGYRWRLVSLNSMFCWPTPQSRDRLYIVFWRKGHRAPDLDITPQAPCHRCETIVAAVQTWKPQALARAINGQPVGKYGAKRQYTYTCPRCSGEVVPFYFAAINAIDFTLEATRIGDRESLGMPALRPRTMERIAYGLEKYGNRRLIVNVKQGDRDSSRAWPADERAMGSIPTWDNYFGLATPSLIVRTNGKTELARDARFDSLPAQTTCQDLGFVFNVGGRRAEAPLDRALPTQETREKFGLCFLAALRGTDASQRTAWASPMDAPIGTVSAGGIHHALIGPGFAPFITPIQGVTRALGVDEVLPTQTASCSHDIIVQGAAQISLRDADAMRVAGLDENLMTQGTKPQQAIVQNAPFITSYYSGGGQLSGIDESLPTVATRERHGIVEAAEKPTVEDSYFRMLQPHEIGAAMAFPRDYVVLGNKREQVKQYGNAVTPPAMELLIRRCVESLHPEVAR